jgi:acetyl esterase/lipase
MSNSGLLTSLIMTAFVLISCSEEIAETENRAPVTDNNGAAASVWSLEDVPIADAVVMENRFPQAKIQFAGGVVGLPDMVYTQLNGYRQLRLDMYLPPDRNTAHPMIMYIHGGGWQGGHSRNSGAFDNWPATLAMIASRGYVVISINYRLGGEKRFPAAIHDVKTALRWLRANAEEYGIDKDRFLVWGASAGGHLAALAETTCNVEELAPPNLPDNLAVESDCVQAAIGWYGLYDLPAMTQQRGVANAYFAGLEIFASPTTYVDSTDAPFLLIHGTSDSIADPSQSINFNEKLLANGVSSNMHMITDVEHSYIGETPAVTRAASIQALELSIEFIQDVFK